MGPTLNSTCHRGGMMGGLSRGQWWLVTRSRAETVLARHSDKQILMFTDEGKVGLIPIGPGGLWGLFDG